MSEGQAQSRCIFWLRPERIKREFGTDMVIMIVAVVRRWRIFLLEESGPSSCATGMHVQADISQ